MEKRPVSCSMQIAQACTGGVPAAQCHATADPPAPSGRCQSCRPHTFDAQRQWGAAAVELVRDGCRDALHDVPDQAVGAPRSGAGIGLQIGTGAQHLAIVLLRQDHKLQQCRQDQCMVTQCAPRWRCPNKDMCPAQGTKLLS